MRNAMIKREREDQKSSFPFMHQQIPVHTTDERRIRDYCWFVEDVHRN